MVEFHQILSLSTQSLIGLRPRLQILSMSGRSHTQGASNLGKRGRSKFWSILAVRSGIVEFHQILRLFNTEPNRPRASPAIFKHVGQVPYSRSFKFGEKGPIKILVHFGCQVRYG